MQTTTERERITDDNLDERTNEYVPTNLTSESDKKLYELTKVQVCTNLTSDDHLYETPSNVDSRMNVHLVGGLQTSICDHVVHLHVCLVSLKETRQSPASDKYPG